jgi:hypothetical protein
MVRLIKVRASRPTRGGLVEQQPTLSHVPRPVRLIGLFGLLCCLSACATLPAPEAAAFRKIAAADRVRFTAITETEREAVTGMAVRQVAANRGKIDYVNCATRDVGDCRLSYRLDGLVIDLGQSAPNMRRLIDRISDYAAAMADLAEARDIDLAVDKAGGAASAAASLAAVVGVPFVKPALDAVVQLFRADLVARRRRLMLENARAAQPVIVAAAARMSAIAEPVRTNIIAAAGIDLDEAGGALETSQARATALEQRAERLRQEAARGGSQAEERLDGTETRLEAVRAVRAAQAEAAIRAGNAVSIARRIDTDFSPLAEGHGQLVARLADPSVSLDQALGDINRFLAVLDAFAAADGS